jgi:hypothetical protein
MHRCLHFGGRLLADYDSGSGNSVELHDVTLKATAVSMAQNLLCLAEEGLKLTRVED